MAAVIVRVCISDRMPVALQPKTRCGIENVWAELRKVMVVIFRTVQNTVTTPIPVTARARYLTANTRVSAVAHTEPPHLSRPTQRGSLDLVFREFSLEKATQLRPNRMRNRET